MIDVFVLKEICRGAKTSRLEQFVEPLNACMEEFGIDNPKRIAAFLAQIAHESGCFYYTQEIASGEAYEGRSDLGNTEEGDGVRFKGRGLIQVTGRSNYADCGASLGLDLLSNPELLERTDYACRSAGWFWSSRNLNDLADKGQFRSITKIINGGFTHYTERAALWDRAKQAMNVA